MENIVIRKSQSYGWTADTERNIGDVPADGMDAAGERFIRMSTYRNRPGNITTTASVFIRRPTNFGGISSYTESTALFQDYHHTIHNLPCTKSTEKTIRAAHDIALQFLDEQVIAAKLFYENLEKKKAVA